MKGDKPSATALLIAASMAFLARDPKLGQLVPPRAAEAGVWFVEEYSVYGRILLRVINHKWIRFLCWTLERATVPGILIHYALRKRYLEEVTRRSLREGFRQVVILGAGFDTLALRLHEDCPETTFIEVDHPATQQPKKRALASRGLPGANMHFLAVDLTCACLAEALSDLDAYDLEAETLFVAEGLLMYLKPAQVDRVFRWTAEQSGRKARFAFTFMEPQPEGRISFRNSSRAVDLWLRLRDPRSDAAQARHSGKLRGLLQGRCPDHGSHPAPTGREGATVGPRELSSISLRRSASRLAAPSMTRRVSCDCCRTTQILLPAGWRA
jgi:methyltransferase (TIGR00027 family)